MKTFPYPDGRPVLHYVAGLALLFQLSACQQLSDSFEETRNPRPEQAVSGPQNESHTTSTYSAATHTSGSTSVTLSDTVKVKAPEIAFFETSAAGWDSIQQQLHDLPELKGQKLYLYQGFYLYDFQGGIVSISLQDPHNREHIDVYRYRSGAWSREEPVKVTGNIPMEEWLLPLDEVKLRTIPKIWATAKEKSKSIEGAGRITHIYFTYMKRGGTKQWYLSIGSPRHDYYLDFDVNGNLKRTR